MDKLFEQLPQGWALSRPGFPIRKQRAGAQAPALYGLSILIIYLFLAALYESWAIPLSVMLVIPLGVIGAVGAASARLLQRHLFPGGLAGDHRPFRQERHPDRRIRGGWREAGMQAREAALEAARLRLRPILMTSIAFVAGVFPLAVATGAGASSQNDIGTGVVGGMLTATLLAIFFVPVFFQMINRGLQHHE